MSDHNEWLVELVAKAIYSQWAFMPAYVEWVDGGNSLRQDDARKLARIHVSENAPADSLRQVPDGELRAIADAIPDGTASFENTDHGRAAAAFYAAALNAFCSPAQTTSVEVETFADLVRKSQPVRTFDEIADPTPAQAGAEPTGCNWPDCGHDGNATGLQGCCLDRNHIAGALEAGAKALPEGPAQGLMREAATTIRALTSAINQCVEHMEYSTPRGRAAYVTARSLSRRDSAAQAGAELPELPEPAKRIRHWDGDCLMAYFTADQMRAYALEARRGGS